MKADFEPAELNDRERTAVVQLLMRAMPAPTDRKAKTEPSRSNIVSLIDALKRSLAVQRGGASLAEGRAI